MTRDEAPARTLAYAREVYAACATVGYVGAEVARLKAMLDGAAPDGELLAAARAAQAGSVAFVSGGTTRKGTE